MTPETSALTATAPVAAAVRTATSLGLTDPTSPVVLREGANLTVHLSPYPIVARIATATAQVRAVTGYQSRELAILDHLARAGAATVRPATLVPAGPHEIDGWHLILLRWYDHDPDRDLGGEQVGTSLRALHDSMRHLDLELPDYLDALDEARRLLESSEGTLDEADRTFLVARAGLVGDRLRRYRGPVQPLHGDVHLGNLLRTPDGPIWGDFEDACLGPVEWDVASLVASTQIVTAGREIAEAAVRVYGVDRESALWRACLEAKVLMFTAWAVLASPRSERAAASLPRRVAWHRRYATE